jgi:hypothetical protein
VSKIIESRNKREGGYLGRYLSVYDALLPKRRHHRKGASRWMTLREWRAA